MVSGEPGSDEGDQRWRRVRVRRAVYRPARAADCSILATAADTELWTHWALGHTTLADPVRLN